MTVNNASRLSSGAIDPRYRIRSVDRALEVLDVLAAATTGLGVSAIARQLGASKSAMFAVLQTLESRNLVSSAGDVTSRVYTLGLGLARLGDRALQQVSLRDVAMPHLAELGAATKLSARVSVLEGESAVVVGQVDSPAGVRFNLNMGGRERLHCSGMGKAILACQPEAVVRADAERHGLVARTRHTIIDTEALLADLAKVRKRGFALDDEEDAEGVCCIGAPVFDHRNGCTGAISVTGLKPMFPPADVLRIGTLVVGTAGRISRELGATA